MMRQIDAGVLPVGESDRLVGMITDRDIAVRAVGEGKGPDTLVREVMSPEICYCFEDQELDEVAANMADVKSAVFLWSTGTSGWSASSRRRHRLVGDPNGAANAVLCGVSEHGGQHSQSNQ
jgi:CBS domain-containing protein